MSIALVIGFIDMHNSSINVSNHTNNSDTIVEVQQPQRPVKMELTFKQGEVSIQKGGANIDFSYSPDDIQGSTSVAYQYRFNNPMSDTMAVNLDSINTTGVTVSYAYSDTPLTTITTTNTLFEVQTIAQNKTKYIYIVVTAD